MTYAGEIALHSQPLEVATAEWYGAEVLPDGLVQAASRYCCQRCFQGGVDIEVVAICAYLGRKFSHFDIPRAKGFIEACSGITTYVVDCIAPARSPESLNGEDLSFFHLRLVVVLDQRDGLAAVDMVAIDVMTR